MAQFKSDFLKELQQRGFIYQCTDAAGLDALLSQKAIPAYIGFDCTAPSLHVGSLMQIMVLRWLQHYGHKPIILLGGATTRIGDPSGKDESRRVLSEEEIEKNTNGIQSVFSRFITFGSGEANALLVNNNDWYENINYFDFMRNYGRHFSINRMIAMKSVKTRLEREQELSFTEFTYMLYQAYDFVELYQRMGCRLQIGGSDQWGNITSGTDLNRRIFAETQSSVKKGHAEKTAETEHYKQNVQLYGLTTPLLTTASGTKMGKTAAGAVWLSADMFSVNDYWQFWRNTEDADVDRFLRFFTELPLDEIARLEALQGAEINEAKIVLANEATKLCHGREAAAQAEQTARNTFSGSGVDKNLPSIEVPKDELERGIPAFELLVKAGLAASNGEAKKLIRGGGARLNDEKIEDEALSVTAAHSAASGAIKLSAGKKRHVLIRVQGAGSRD